MSRRNHHVALVVALSLASSAACDESGGAGADAEGDGADSSGESYADVSTPTPVAQALHEHALSATNRATPDQIVVVNLEAPGHERHPSDSGADGVDEIPYTFSDAGTYKLCVKDIHGDDHLFEVLDDATGGTMAQVSSGDPCVHQPCGCVELAVTPGDYTLRITHASVDTGRADAPASETWFLHPFAEVTGDSSGKADDPAATQPQPGVYGYEGFCPNCNLSNLDLSAHVLTDSHLDGADLSGANLSHAVFTGPHPATWTNADGTPGVEPFSCALQGATFSASTNLHATNFNACDLTGAKFIGADLSETIFTNCQMNGVNLAGATLAAAEILSSNLCDATVASPLALSGTVMLDGSSVPFSLIPVPHWGSLEFDNTTIIVDTSMESSNFEGLDLSQVNWVIQPGTNMNATRWKGTKATFGAGANLTGSHLQGADLSGIVLSANDLSGAQMTNALFENATMKATILSGVTATNVSFKGAIMNDAVFDTGGTTSLYGALLSGANLTSAHMSNVDLSYAEGTGGTTILNGTQLPGATLVHANLATADLTNANLKGAKLGNANLSGATLQGTDFQPNGPEPTVADHVWFCGAKLDGTKFQGTGLTGSYFPAAGDTVPGPDGTNVNCGATDVSTAKTSGATVCPDGLQPSNGLACAGVEWDPVVKPANPCCTPHKNESGTWVWCSPTKPTGGVCVEDCDCRSKSCTNQKVCE